MKVYKKLFTILTLVAFVVIGTAQPTKVAMYFNPTFNTVPLTLFTRYTVDETKPDSIIFSAFKCYISNVTLLQDSKVVYTEKNSFHLLDASVTNGLFFELFTDKNEAFNRVQFTIGIDSATHYQGLKTGCLDPLNGMYWTWNSGYINFKIEGSSNLATSRNKTFQFHIGGFRHPYQTAQTIQLQTNKKNIFIQVELSSLINANNLIQIPSIMTPGLQAAQLAKQFASSFTIQ